MIDIYCTGCSFLGVRAKFEDLKQAIRDSGADDFIEFSLQDGTKCVVKKSSINGFCESD